MTPHEIAWDCAVIIAALCFLELCVLLIRAIGRGVRQVWRGE